MSKYYRSVLNVLTPAFSSTKSMAFDGVDDYIDCGNISALNGVTEATWMGWFNRSGTSNYYLFGTWGTTAGEKQFVPLQNGGVTGSIVVYMATSTGVQKTMYKHTYDVTATIGNWHHYAFVYNEAEASDADKMKVYMDGVELANTLSGAALTSLNSSTASFEIGKLGGYTTNEFNGNIDEVAVFTSALSPTNISAIYNSGVPADLSSYSPTAWYRMGENGSWKSPQWLLPENSNVDNSRFSNYSFEFDGINDQINLTDIPFVRAGGQNFSISAWVYCNSSSQNGFFSTAVNASFAGQINLLKNSNRQAVFTIVTSSTGNIEIRSSNASITSNTWHHIVATFDGTQAIVADRVNIYVNGVLDNDYLSAGTATNLPSGSSFIFNRIGRTALGVRQNGKIDNLAIWDSTLTAGNVTTLYNSGSPVDISTLSPTAGWKLGEEATFSTDWTIPDSIGSFDGTSVNMTIEDRVGEAPNSSNNSLSYNMDEADREEDVPS
ncbi:MAG: putative concanavalin A-like lectin/glucanases superfamily protein [Prokaryotic dsDNA virus sp.]|nr:MAG: putative concanavalin A-like lectin/glucanases superfamily protein [Prokaryotic dsDNA virus sp.]